MLYLLIALLSIPAISCQNGCTEYQGSCACDAVPEKAVQTIQPSDEKPPTDKMPSYQREGIVADMPPSMAVKDLKADQDRDAAELQGKLSAGLK